MNRGVYLAIPEPLEHDLKETDYTIAELYDNTIRDYYKEFFKNLASTYYKNRKKLKEIPEFQDF